MLNSPGAGGSDDAALAASGPVGSRARTVEDAGPQTPPRTAQLHLRQRCPKAPMSPGWRPTSHPEIWGHPALFLSLKPSILLSQQVP